MQLALRLIYLVGHNAFLCNWQIDFPFGGKSMGLYCAALIGTSSVVKSAIFSSYVLVAK
jgi:hypothetical protein